MKPTKSRKRKAAPNVSRGNTTKNIIIENCKQDKRGILIFTGAGEHREESADVCELMLNIL